MVKPVKLHKSDVIGIISPSWGGPSVFPHIYENGLKNLKALGFEVKEFPTARGDAKYQYQYPRVRAEDVNAAFAEKEVKGIITTIGGDDSVRILPFLNKETITNNPKFFMGYSDTTILTTFLRSLGMVSFNGPSIMAGFSQMESEGEDFKKHLEGLEIIPNKKRKSWIQHLQVLLVLSLENQICQLFPIWILVIQIRKSF